MGDFETLGGQTLGLFASSEHAHLVLRTRKTVKKTDALLPSSSQSLP